MKEYDVMITETYENTVTVRTESEKAALEKVEKQWSKMDHLGPECFVGANFKLMAAREVSVDAVVYDYLRDLYNETRDTDAEDLARICGTDPDAIQQDLQKTLRMIESVQNLVAHKL